eukprot:3941905-Rhodomonas_salina.1
MSSTERAYGATRSEARHGLVQQSGLCYYRSEDDPASPRYRYLPTLLPYPTFLRYFPTLLPYAVCSIAPPYCPTLLLAYVPPYAMCSTPHPIALRYFPTQHAVLTARMVLPDTTSHCPTDSRDSYPYRSVAAYRSILGAVYHRIIP